MPREGERDRGGESDGKKVGVEQCGIKEDGKNLPRHKTQWCAYIGPVQDLL